MVDKKELWVFFIADIVDLRCMKPTHAVARMDEEHMAGIDDVATVEFLRPSLRQVIAAAALCFAFGALMIGIIEIVGSDARPCLRGLTGAFGTIPVHTPAMDQDCAEGVD